MSSEESPGREELGGEGLGEGCDREGCELEGWRAGERHMDTNRKMGLWRADALLIEASRCVFRFHRTRNKILT